MEEKLLFLKMVQAKYVELELASSKTNTNEFNF